MRKYKNFTSNPPKWYLPLVIITSGIVGYKVAKNKVVGAGVGLALGYPLAFVGYWVGVGVFGNVRDSVQEARKIPFGDKMVLPEELEAMRQACKENSSYRESNPEVCMKLDVI